MTEWDRKLARGCVLVFVLVATASARAVMTPARPPRRSADGWAGAGVVRAPGGPFLTDAFGRRLQLHGVDLVAKCGGGAVPTTAVGSPCVGPEQGVEPAFVLSPTASDPGRRFTAVDAATLARLGFNVVRLGIVWEGLEPGPAGAEPNDPRYCTPHQAGTPFAALGASDPFSATRLDDYLARTDRIVALLAHVGIRVLIDMHQDAFGSAFSNSTSNTPWNGEGAPRWATCTSGNAFASPLTWHVSYGDPAVESAIHNFFANDVSGDLQGEFARVWQAVALHYRANPEVLGYEIYNEPDDLAVPEFDPELQCDYAGPLNAPLSCAQSGAQALPDGLIGAIQSADRRHVVFFEPAFSANYGTPETIGIAEPLRFSRVALAFHMYGNASTVLSLDASERAASQTEQPGGPAWMMDEFGASGNATAAATTVALADKDELSWSYWSALQLHDPTGDAHEGLLDQNTRRPLPAKARALAVPYPWATAGTPGGQSFDRATATFHYSYAPTRSIRAPTEIMLPPYTYPHGYTVRVRGAVVVSAADAPVLELSAFRRTPAVYLTVSRRAIAPALSGTAASHNGRHT